MPADVKAKVEEKVASLRAAVDSEDTEAMKAGIEALNQVRLPASLMTSIVCTRDECFVLQAVEQSTANNKLRRCVSDTQLVGSLFCHDSLDLVLCAGKLYRFGNLTGFLSVPCVIQPDWSDEVACLKNLAMWCRKPWPWDRLSTRNKAALKVSQDKSSSKNHPDRTMWWTQTSQTLTRNRLLAAVVLLALQQSGPFSSGVHAWVHNHYLTMYVALSLGSVPVVSQFDHAIFRRIVCSTSDTRTVTILD